MSILQKKFGNVKDTLYLCIVRFGTEFVLKLLILKDAGELPAYAKFIYTFKKPLLWSIE